MDCILIIGKPSGILKVKCVSGSWELTLRNGNGLVEFMDIASERKVGCLLVPLEWGQGMRHRRTSSRELGMRVGGLFMEEGEK